MSESSRAEELRERLAQMVSRAEGLSSRARLTVRLLAGYRSLRPGRRPSPWLLLALALGAACLCGPLVARPYLRSLRYHRCLVEQPSASRHMFRPAVDCSVCEGLQHVDKIANVDPKLFEQRYAYSGRPVVVTDAMANWTGPHQLSFGWLKQLYKGHQADCQFFPYNTEFNSLSDVFEMNADRALLRAGTKPWYVGWSNCDETIGTILREHYERPYFLPDTAESEKTDWIFMGSPGYGAPMHVDDVDYPSWQAQIRGRKKWTLEPPRECHYSCSRLEVVVEPGEIIVLDTNKWYHQTLIVSEDISITIGAEYD